MKVAAQAVSLQEWATNQHRVMSKMCPTPYEKNIGTCQRLTSCPASPVSLWQQIQREKSGGKTFGSKTTKGVFFVFHTSVRSQFCTLYYERQAESPKTLVVKLI